MEPESLWIHALRATDNRVYEAWKTLFDDLEYPWDSPNTWTVSDGALAIRKTATEGKGESWGLDHFHAIRSLYPQQKRFETRVDQLIKDEKRWEEKAKHPTSEARSKFRSRIQNAVLDLEGWEILMKWLKEALWWIDPENALIKTKAETEERP